MKSKKILFTGHVQAVSFRYHVERISRNFKVFGYVKNIPNYTGAPYSGNQVELLLQGAPDDVSKVVKLVYAYFGTKHIKAVKVFKVDTKEKYTDFTIDYGNEKDYYKTSFAYTAPKYNTGNSIPIRPISGIEKNCTVCHFLTARTCEKCGEPLCGVCFGMDRHICAAKKSIKFPAISPDNKMLTCDCKKIQTTGRCTECGKAVCNSCKKTGKHICGTKSNFTETTAIYLCFVCKKGRTSFQCNHCKRAVCPECQGNHDCKAKKAILIPADSYDNVGNCVSCGIKTTRICKDCGNALCSICEDTILDSQGNRLHDCQNKNEKTKSGGFIQAIRAALWL